MRVLLALLACLFFCAEPVVAQTRTKRQRPATTKKSKKEAEVPTMPYERAPKVGDKGRLVDFEARVIQVIDEDNSLAHVYWFTPPRVIRTGKGADDWHFNPDSKLMKETVWLTYPTKGVVDDQTVETGDQQFEVVGTKSYEAATGKRTVLHVKLVEDGGKAKGK